MSKKIDQYTELAAQPATTDLFLLELASNGQYRKIKWSNLVADSSITTAKLADASVTSAKVAAGMPVQIVSTNFGALATGTTVLPFDDTIPQNTEGDQYMTQAITPKSATNILVIEATVFLSSSASNELSAALFQDSTANALAVSSAYMATATGRCNLKVTYAMTAGTTSSTTFKIRAGSQGAGTTTFNGSNGARLFGTTPKSNMTITEYKA